MAEYQPGVCNIGRVERRRRLYLGIASFVAAVVFTAWVLTTGQPYRLLAGTFLLVFGGLFGYLQHRLEFCVAFAALARYDLTGSGDDVGTVQEETALFKDRMRALQILVVSLALAGLLTFGTYLLGLFVVNPPRA